MAFWGRKAFACLLVSWSFFLLPPRTLPCMMGIVFIRNVSNFLLLLLLLRPKKTWRKTSCIVCSNPQHANHLQGEIERKVGSYPSGGLEWLCPNRIVFYHYSYKSTCAKRPYLLVRTEAYLWRKGLVNLFGGCVFGYNVGVVSGLTKPLIQCTLFDPSDNIPLNLYIVASSVSSHL